MCTRSMGMGHRSVPTTLVSEWHEPLSALSASPLIRMSAQHAACLSALPASSSRTERQRSCPSVGLGGLPRTQNKAVERSATAYRPSGLKPIGQGGSKLPNGRPLGPTSEGRRAVERSGAAYRPT